MLQFDTLIFPAELNSQHVVANVALLFEGFQHLNNLAAIALHLRHSA